MDDDVSQRCRIVSDTICAGTEQDRQDFRYCAAYAVNVAAKVARVTTLNHSTEPEAVPTITGSASEFYIEPMLSCIEDYDIMYYFSHEIAIPDGYQVPGCLTHRHSKPLKVYRIRESDTGIANYVNLAHSEETLSIRQSDTFALQVTKRTEYYCLSNRVHDEFTHVHGPANMQEILYMHVNHGEHFNSAITSDFVRCMRCPVWPPQALRWPLRPRYNGWPDSATITHVVGLGCDVVPVSHAYHKDDTSQWRLSFSRAEVVLLNSWTPLQQIVYHMLRFFVKTERLTKTSNNDNHGNLFSMYHVKTLMLWVCELNTPKWWSSKSAIQLCAELLNMFGRHLFERNCPHYFIEKCNLLQYFTTHGLHIQGVICHLSSVQDFRLAEWFIDKYLIKYAMKNCPAEIQQVLRLTEPASQLETTLSAIIDWRSENFRQRSLRLLDLAAGDLSDFLSCNISVRMCKVYMTQRSKLGPLYHVFVAFLFLKCSGEIKIGQCLYDEILHVLTTVTDYDPAIENAVFEPRGTVTTATVNALMTSGRRDALADLSCSPRGFSIELTKALLQLVLWRRDRHSDNSVKRLVNVYLALLYYNQGHFDTAIELCRSRNCLSFSGEDRTILKLDGSLLSEISTVKYSADISIVSGLSYFYQHVKGQAMADTQLRKFYTNFYSEETIVQFVTVKHCQISAKTTAAGQMNLYQAMQQYRKYVTSTSRELFLNDILLLRLIIAGCPQYHVRPELRRSDSRQQAQHRMSAASTVNFDLNKLSDMLVSLSVQLLTSFRQFEANHFGSDCVASTADFEALYAYRQGQYDKCLTLCQDIVSNVLLMNDVGLPRVCIDTSQLVLMDDDIASILGLIRLTGILKQTATRTATQLTIALYLEIQCLLRKMEHPLPLVEVLLQTPFAYRRHDTKHMLLSRWILAFVYRKARLYLQSAGLGARSKSVDMDYTPIPSHSLPYFPVFSRPLSFPFLVLPSHPLRFPLPCQLEGLRSAERSHLGILSRDPSATACVEYFEPDKYNWWQQ